MAGSWLASAASGDKGRVHPVLASLAPRRIAVLRALMLGDVLCAVPALRALREGFPDAEITLIGLGWARELAGRLSHLVDGFLELPGWPGLREVEPRVAEIPAFLAEAQRRRFDLAVQLHGSGRVANPLVALLAARRTTGFHAPGGYRPDPDLFVPYEARGHEIHRLLRLPAALGLPVSGDELEFPLRPSDADELPPGLPAGSYACVHAGSRSAGPWPAERFAAVADELTRHGLRVALTGSAGERDVTCAVAKAMRAEAVDLAGRTSLGALGALVRDAAIVVSNDTGVSHVAAALRTPSVVVVTTSDPERWAPLDRARHRVVVRPQGAEPVLAEVEALLPAPV